MHLTTILLLNLAVIGAIVTSLWLLSLYLRDASVVDIFWGAGFVVIAWVSVMVSGGGSARGWLMTALVTVWGSRLAIYLAMRNIGKGEDYRYTAMRERAGSSFWLLSLFTVFWLQGIVMLIVSLPIQYASTTTSSLSVIDFVGIIIWLIGLGFEAIGDYQLTRFKRDPANKGRVFDRGLWRFTRHPNYFGDFLVWWGFFTIALAGGGWWTVISPALMSFFLMRVSGVTLLEQRLSSSKPGYAEYVRQTSAFFPWPPSKPKLTTDKAP